MNLILQIGFAGAVIATLLVLVLVLSAGWRKKE